MNPLFFILLFSLIISGSNSTTNSTVPVDCVPDSYILGIKTEEVCSQRGCIYNPHVPSGPFCTFPQNYGYKLASKTRTKSIRQRLQLFDCSFHLPIRIHDSNQITDNSERYEVPLKLDLPTKSSNKHLYDVNFIDSPIFGFEIIRVSSQRVILSTRNMPGLIFSNQFIQLPLSLNEKVDMYGLGENEQASLRHDMSWKFWNGWARDSTPNGFGNLYGVFPLMTALEPEGTASTIVFLNSNAQEWESLAQYASTFGKYEIPPYWSLGHHLCRYGYKSTEAIRQAYRRTLKYNIPLDVQWADIDYMDRFMDFTIDPVHFKDLPDFVKEIHGDGKHFVPILDPGIDFESKGMDGGTYVPYELGQKMNVWVKRSDGSPMVGKVWPYGKVHFPDFFKRNTTIWWELCVKDFHSKMEIDGIWIDMNEPSNFADGDVDKGCAANALNNPPYLPRNLQGSKIAAKTICSDHTQVLDEKVVPHYDLHSLYGLSEARATIRALRLATKTRGFVLSRSTYLGSGRYTAKWLGDNKSL
ncbi:Sucraseisomaltase_ intestinallike [Caligus rogercresseyi]|uniref:Sucraseisomaltase_ intestinallike n=1 Tax=Caligus rogercresseyi TaxID=217165 RepID=A0A7T8GX50_CALRO|nr:Sucraseisomaltase_ intestinallike [Caligus rogercresseyi]